jgi:DNA-binding winged helix-turn-helix (wHTH) protein/TolB-like protein/Tfp pilus assembly protein PilF
MPSLTNHLYLFGEFSLDAQGRVLKKAGAAVPLTRKAFDALLLLVQNTGRIVTKDELLKAIWPDTIVEESNLTQTIFMVRKALGETSDLRYILTVQGQGYRFLFPVTEPVSVAAGTAAFSTRELHEPYPSRDGLAPASSDALPAVPRGHHFAATRRIALLTSVLAGLLVLSVYFVHRRQASLARPAVVQHSLAILPLRNLRQNPDDDFLGFSLADAVITRLGPVSSLSVRPSSAIEKYKGQTIDLKKVGAELNVNTLMTGTFIHDGDNLRITWQLVDVKTEKLLGRDVIDLKYNNLLTVQDNVTQQIIRGLALNLSPSEAARLTPIEPVNSLAYEYYLRGVDLMGSHEFPAAIEMLEKSAAIDPNYPLTWAYLGQSYNSTASFQFGGREQYQKARAAFEHALALQPAQLEARMFLANLLVDTGEVEKAVPLLRETLKDNPNNAALHWVLGYAYRFGGMLQESVAECEQARRMDPLVKANGAVLNSYLYLGEYDKFLASLPDADDSSFLVFYRAFGEFHQKKWPLAARDFDRAWELDHTLYTQIGQALSDSITRRNSQGLDLLRASESEIQQRGVGDPEAAYKVAQAYAVLGDKASALRMLRYSIQNGFFPWPYFATDPLVAGIRHEPQYSQLMEMAKARHTAFRNRFF